MIDPTIEQALAPNKEDWKEPLWTKFKNYAIGFCAALLVVCAIVAAIAYFAPSLAPDDSPSTMTIEPIPQVTAKAPAQKRSKVATEKIANQATNKPAMPSFEAAKQPVKKPRIDDGFTTEFDKQVLNLESKL